MNAPVPRRNGFRMSAFARLIPLPGTIATIVTIATIPTLGGCEQRVARAPSHDVARVRGAHHACLEQAEVEACALACDGGEVQSCTELGRIYELGLNVTRDVTGAAALYRKACDGGDMSGCYSAAYVLENGIAGRRDANCALAMYKYACDGGETRGCMMAGFMYRAGIDVKRDDAGAAAAFKKACEAGYDAGCQQLKAVTTPE